MKTIASFLVGIILLAPVGAHAQVQPVSEVNQQLIALLMEQVKILQEQLAQLLIEQIQANNEVRDERVDRKERRTLRETNKTRMEEEVRVEEAKSKAKIEVDVSGDGGTVGKDTIRIGVETYNAAGKKEKFPVLVATDCPDLPGKFELGTKDYPSMHFIVAKDAQGVVTGGPEPFPSTAGKFTFTFTMGDVEESVEVEVKK